MNPLINDSLRALNALGIKFCDYAGSMFIQSGVLIIFLLIIDFIIRKRVRATLRYWVWMLVFVKLILPPSLSFPTGFGYWQGKILPAAQPASEQESNVSQHKATGRPVIEDTPLPIEATQIQPSQISSMPTSPTISVVSCLNTLTWQAIAFILWFVGVMVFSILLFQRIIYVRRLITQSKPADNRFVEILNQCRQQIGVRRPIQLRLSNDVSSPAVCGLLKPIILIPAGLLETLPPDKLRAVLIHEQAHIKRGDLWINCMQTFIQIAYFYNPLVWLANIVVRRIREQAVDEMVLVTMGAGAEDYSNTLIDIAEKAFFKTSLSLRLIGVVESRKALNRRITHILNQPIPKSAKIGALGLIVIIVSAAVLLPMAKADKKNSPVVRPYQANEQSIATLPNGVAVKQSKASPIGNYALGFDGIKDFMEIHASESLKLGRNFTIQTWIKPEFPDTNTPDNRRNLLSKGGYINEHPDDKGNRMVHAYGFGLNLIPKEGSMVELDMSTANGGIYTSPILFRYESGWLHLAIVSRKEGGGASRGVNYIHTGEVPYQPAPNSNIIVGGDSLIPMGNPFKGQIAELRIWNRALSSDEVEHYKTVTLTGDEPNLVGCWTFEQGQGQRVHDLSRFKNDASLGSSYAVEDSDPAWVRIGTEKENEKLRGTQAKNEKTDAQVKIAGEHALPTIQGNKEWTEFFASQRELHSFDLRVVHDKTDTPLNNVDLEIRMDVEILPNKVKWIKAISRTGSAGMCRIKMPVTVPKRINISVRKEGYSPLFFLWSPQSYNLPDQYTISLVPATTIGGFIKDPKGNPIEDATVQVSVWEKEHVRYDSSQLKTDRRGYWQFDSVPQNLDGLSFTVHHKDYYPVELFGEFGQEPVVPIKELRNRNAVIILQEPLKIHGVVTNEKGQPITNAIIIPGRRGDNYRASLGWTAKTDNYGRFTGPYEQKDEGKATTLIVKATGYAPVIREIKLSADTLPLKFQLGPGQTIRGLVIDQNVNPVKDVHIAVRKWDEYQIDNDNLWKDRTDSQGRFVWTEAPKNQLEFYTYEKNYLFANCTMSPAEKDYVITLTPAIKVRGKVTDVETDEAIKRFRLMPLSKYKPGQGLDILRIDAEIYTDGQFEFLRLHPFSGQMIGIEAEGYKAAVSAPLNIQEGELVCDFKLHKAKDSNDLTTLPDYVEQRKVTEFLSIMMEHQQNKPNWEIKK
jgi:beta-lactamase regulating signal transducer with metallopeptidase domain